MSTSKLPLWQLMEAAFLEGRKLGHCDRLGYAAELRAIAKWLKDNDSNFQMGGDAAVTADLLLEEADFAERGEG